MSMNPEVTLNCRERRYAMFKIVAVALLLQILEESKNKTHAFEKRLNRLTQKYLRKVFLPFIPNWMKLLWLCLMIRIQALLQFFSKYELQVEEIMKENKENNQTTARVAVGATPVC